jgi:hypothetical protein
MMTNARVSPTTIRVFTPASATPRQSAPMMFSDWNLLWSLDIALPRVHAAFIKLEMLIRSEEKTILRYWVPRITMKARWRSPAESQSAMCRCQYPVKSTDLPRFIASEATRLMGITVIGQRHGYFPFKRPSDMLSDIVATALMAGLDTSIISVGVGTDPSMREDLVKVVIGQSKRKPAVPIPTRPREPFPQSNVGRASFIPFKNERH